MSVAIDGRTRQCSCGHFDILSQETRRCADYCMRTFTLYDYPPGYFAYKYHVRPGSSVGTCPPCEADILERPVHRMRDEDPLTVSASSQRAGLRILEDIELLRTGQIVTDRHRKNALNTHGKPMNGIG